MFVFKSLIFKKKQMCTETKLLQSKAVYLSDSTVFPSPTVQVLVV